MPKLPSGREETFNKLYEQTHDQVFGYLRHYTSDDHLIEDLMQESYLKVWERIDKINNVEQALPLVKTYTKNLLIDVIRKRMKEDMQWLETLQEDVAGIVETPQSTDSKQKLEILDLAIDRLPQKCKTVYIYHREEGLSYAEIAALLSVSVSMVEKHMSKAIRLLKKELLSDPSLLLLVVLAGEHWR